MTVKTALLTLGRLPKALELTRGLHRAGVRVIVAEPFGWHVCRPSRSVDLCVALPAPNVDPEGYADALCNTIERENVDLVIPVSEEAIHALNVRERVSASFYSPDRDIILRLHDKLHFSRTARALGLSVPPTYPVDTDEARLLVRNSAVIVKPSHGCSGVGVEKFDRFTTLPKMPGGIAQTFIRGRHVSTFSVAHEGRTRVTAMYEGTLMSGTVAVCFRRVRELPAVENWVREFIERQSLSGFMSFDFIVDDDGTAWAIECNPRVTSGIHFLRADDLACAVLNPDATDDIRFREQEHFGQFYPALTETYKYFFEPSEFARHFRTLWNANDVVFDRTDPLPFFMMTPASWPILRQTIFQGRSFGEAATHDIAWQGTD
ncbi:MAG: ATP-grasp domain-containing protein [Gammaproteobacteria bacterium]